MPLPMNSTANRFGNPLARVDSAAKTGSDSSHGSAIVAPAARSTVRLEIFVMPSRRSPERLALRLKKFDAYRRWALCEDARRFQSTVSRVDPRDEDCVRTLIADREISSGRPDAEMARRESTRSLFLDICE